MSVKEEKMINNEVKKRVIELKKTRDTCINEESKVGKETYLSLGLIKQNGWSRTSVLLYLDC